MTLTDTELGLLIAGIALSGVILGSLLAGAFSLLAGHLEHKRQREQWLRDELRELVVGIASAAAQTVAGGLSKSERDAIAERLAVQHARLGVFGSLELTRSMSKLAGHAAHAADPRNPAEPGTFADAQTEFYEAARKELNIPRR